MALTKFQRELCRVLAEQRIASGESYVAGGAALNELLGTPRVSMDVDLFHDTGEALAATWEVDRALLSARGYELSVVHERSSFVEAEVSRGTERVLLQWLQDSAYRFFPLVRSAIFGLTLHPFDLATNKVLALVGRLEVRDWIDTIESSERIQPLGYLAWAASGKDPGFNPASILEHASRSARYSREEVSSLRFDGSPPDAVTLAERWHRILAESRSIVAALPPAEVGRCLLERDGSLYTRGERALRADLERGRLLFHRGSIRGALPSLMANGN